MLRQGLPVADVCFLVAEGAPHVFRPPTSATRGIPPERLGYNFDGCAPETLISRATARNGRITMPDGMSYAVLVLPERETMSPALLRKVKDLVLAGATIIGPRPKKSPSLQGYPDCDTEIKRLASELWGACDGRKIEENQFGKGRIVWRAGDQTSLQHRPEDPLKMAKWIWYPEGNPANRAPVGKRLFRRMLILDSVSSLESARAYMTADNSFALTVNGQLAGEGNNFHNLDEMDIQSYLKTGTNMIEIVAENGGDSPNPAGVIGGLFIQYRNGQTKTLFTDGAWTVTKAASETSTSPISQPTVAAQELGSNGMGPWGDVKFSANFQEQYSNYSVVTNLLNQMGITPDFVTEGPINYIHRKIDQTDIYFLANKSDRIVQIPCSFRISGGRPERWNPINGKIEGLPEYEISGGHISIPLRFEPYESCFIVFNAPAPTTPSAKRNSPDLIRISTITGPWEVFFDPRWGGPGNVTFNGLEDWSKRAEAGIKYYSGLAIYRKTLQIPKASDSGFLKSTRIFLDLGIVKNLARVRLNNHELGTVWCAPWRVDITDFVQKNNNLLEIEVANLWPNRLMGDLNITPGERITQTTWNPFKKDSALLESGLLGPVTVLTTQQP